MGLNIDFKMLPMKAHYFLYNAGTGSVVPFMPVFARQLGFSTFVVGIIYTILPILGLVAKPLFGALADRYHRHKSMFIFFIFLTIISFASIKFIQPIEKTTKVDLHCNDGVADLKYCTETIDFCAADNLINYTNRNVSEITGIRFDLACEVHDDWMWEFICQHWDNNTNCVRGEGNTINLEAYVKISHVQLIKQCVLFEIDYAHYQSKLSTYNKGTEKIENMISCPKKALNGRTFKLNCQGKTADEHVMNAIAEPGVNDQDITMYSQFWYFFAAMAISWIGMAVVVSVGDAICFDLLGKRHDLYGRQRLWGAVGWGIFSIIAGILVDENSAFLTIKNYSVIYYLMTAALLPNMLVSSCLEIKPNQKSSSIVKDIGKLFKSARTVIFFLWCISIGLCTALVWNFLFWHLEDLAEQRNDCGHQERMKTLQGIALGIQCFGGELPFFFISGWVIKKLGHVNAMTMVLFTFGIRLFLYSLLTNPWWVLPIELMQGITFGIFYATMTMYANIVAPNGTAATLQGLVGAIFEGIGVSSGSFIAGYLMKETGGSTTFRIFGICALILSAIHFAIQYFMDKYKTKSAYQPTALYTTPYDDMQMLEEDDYNLF